MGSARKLRQKPSLVPHEAQQKAVREIVVLKAQGRSLRAIAADIKSATWACRASSRASGRRDAVAAERFSHTTECFSASGPIVSPKCCQRVDVY
jgi:uncharacterized protein YoaH (UPF0181 family)